MADTVTCDNCRSTVARGGIVDWWKLDRFEIDVRLLGEQFQTPRHYCSLQCLQTDVSKNAGLP